MRFICLTLTTLSLAFLMGTSPAAAIPELSQTKETASKIQVKADPDINAVVIDSESKELIFAAAMKSESFKTDLFKFLDSAHDTAVELRAKGKSWIPALEKVSAHQDPYVLVKNTPVDTYVPPTPSDGRHTLDKKTHVAEFAQAVMGFLLNGALTIYPWKKQYSHPAFHDGFPVPPSKHEVSALGAGKNLPYHLDLENLRNWRLAPDALFLGCVREGNDDKQVTKLLLNQDILSLIPEHIQKDMADPRFLLPNKKNATDWVVSGQPILYQDEETQVSTLIAMVDGPLAIRPADDQDFKAWRALHYLQYAIAKADEIGMARKVHFSPGDILVFNNKAVIHSRESSKIPSYDGSDRVLIRSFWMFNEDSVISERIKVTKWTSETA